MTFNKFFLILFTCCNFTWASDLTISTDSVFAIVTHKAGLLSNLGHDHFIHAGKYDAKAQMNAGELSSFRFEMTLQVEELVVDDPAAKQKWFPDIQKAAVLDEAFSDVSEKDRKKIRKSMLGKKQLKADQFPTIKAWVEGVQAKQGSVGGLQTTHELTLKMEICGEQKTTKVPAAVTMNGQDLHIRAIAPLKFSDFGIKPFSAMLGSVANDDGFHIFVDLKAS